MRFSFLPPFADAGGHFGFDVVHRAVDRIAERIEQPLIARRRIEQRHAFGHMEVEIVADRPVRIVCARSAARPSADAGCRTARPTRPA